MDVSNPLNRASAVVRMHHPTKTSTTTEVTATNILVEAFEMLKQKSKSPMKNVTILLSRTRGKRHK